MAEPELSIEAMVKVKRLALRLSQRELARRAGLSAAYVHSLENGSRIPTLRSFARLVVQLRLTPMEIFLLVANEAKRERSSE